MANIPISQKNDFGNGSVIGHIVKLAIPMTFAQFINVLYNIIDRIYIGHLAESSTQALTGVGLCLPIITIIIAFANLFGMGGAPLFSMARGAGNPERSKKIMANAFSMLLLSGAFLVAVCYTFMKPILYLFGASDATYPYASAYLIIYLLGTWFVMISLGMNFFINAQGFGVIGMLTVSIGAVLNLILDPILIFYLNLGVRGAAIATILSQFVSTVWVLRFLTSDKAIIKLDFSCLKPDFRLIREIVGLGLSGFVMSVTNGIVQVVCNSTLQTYGGDLYIGIMTVANSVREVVSMPAFGLTNASQPVMSFNYGAKKYDRIRTAIKGVTIYSISIMLVMWALIFFFPGFFIGLFNNDAALLSEGSRALHLYFFGIFMMSFQISGQSTYMALGKSKFAIFFSLLRKVIIVVPLTILLPRLGLGTDGVFLAEPISNAIGGLACYCTMIWKVWPTLKNEM
ncbi:MAG: MATE family efflux transporter [Dorea sp.]|nr:MATE family efflux transporter [Dorea sp.]